MTGNATKFKEVIPWASGMARSCFLHWDSRAEILGDLNRWSVTADESVPSGNCKLWNPALLPPRSVRQTVSYNKQVITAIKSFKPTSLNGVPALVLRKPQPHSQGEEQFTYEVFVLGEKSRSICMFVKLQPHASVGNVVAHVSDDTSALEAIQKYCQDVTFQYDNHSSPTQSNSVIAEAFECVNKTQLCTICIVELIQSSFGKLFAWSTPEIPNVAEVCVLRPLRRKKRSTRPKVKQLLDKENISDNLPLEDAFGDFDSGALEMDHDHDIADDCTDSDQSDCSQHSGLHRSLGDNDGTNSDFDAFDDEWDLAMGPYNGDGSESNHDTDSGGEVDDILEAEEASHRIAAVASDQLADQNKDNKELDNLDTLIDPLGSGGYASVLNVHDMEQESWLREVLLGRGHTQGVTVTVSDVHQPASSSSSTAGAPPPFGQVHNGAIRWKDALQVSSTSLVERRDALQQMELGKGKDVSLMLRIVEDGSVSIDFVQWSDITSLKGRSVRTDENDGLICPVNWLSSPVSFAGAECLHPAIGTGVRRVKKKDRPQVSESVMRLKAMYTVCLLGNPNACEDPELLGPSNTKGVVSPTRSDEYPSEPAGAAAAHGQRLRLSDLTVNPALCFNIASSQLGSIQPALAAWGQMSLLKLVAVGLVQLVLTGELIAFRMTPADFARTDSVVVTDARENGNTPSHSAGNRCGVNVVVSGPGCLTWSDDHYSFSERMRVYSETIHSVPFPYVHYVPRRVGSTAGVVGHNIPRDSDFCDVHHDGLSNSSAQSDSWELVSSEPDEHPPSLGSNDVDPHDDDDDDDPQGHDYDSSDSEVELEIEMPIETASTASSQGSVGRLHGRHTPCSNVDTHSVGSLDVECFTGDIANLNDVESSCSSHCSSPCKSPCQPLLKRLRH
eukprot:s3708_g1.t1